MKKMSLPGAMRLCAQYQRRNAEEREALQRARLKAMVEHARKSSPYYAALYRDLPESWTLSNLPPVSKRELMASFDDWATDRAITMAGVNEFLSKAENIGREYLGRYLVFTTSGSTGAPLVALCDPSANNVMAAVNAMRAFARKSDLRAFLKRGGKTMGVFATGFYLGCVSVRAKQRQMPWKRKQLAVTSALLPTEQIVAELNAFRPAMLGGYPSNLELLIPYKESGRLNIAPALIMTGGEQLPDPLRARLAEAFGCYVQTSYSCTEGGTIACECEKQRFHLNDDWVIAEPVDEYGRPVPPGVQGEKLLLTNLFNFTQPYIRYELTDRVTLHREGCPCGNPSPWVELEGRTDDVLVLNGGAGELRLAPLSVYAVLKEAKGLVRFQLVMRPGNVGELRVECEPGTSREDAFARAKAAFLAYCKRQGAEEVTLTLSETLPMQQPGSGKFKHIVWEP